MGYRLACPARQARRLFVLDKKTGHMNVLLILEFCYYRLGEEISEGKP